ncbi:hypothetical protein OED52_13855 [Rhodococcus sp. Z13]|uniref:Uncharacterized protein n=1 Tax=Rhodococcus sacchari TaxID=2962047 RepID=A0ACD4DCK2_9NOCA|nr:hypothetical protein [Rhodococcus sp. Z13]UYP17756.1 hypothetical protein OED52_13855 [Rhodococcus sp. Z13]
MMTHSALAKLIAETLMPSSPEFVLTPANEVAAAILERHEVVELPAPSFTNEHGTTWKAECGDLQLATVADGDVWVAGEVLSDDELAETAAALLAAARMQSTPSGVVL